MNKREFVRLRQPVWRRFDTLIGQLHQHKGKVKVTRDDGVLERPREPAITEFSRLFRELSNDLATVRSRDWGEGLEKYLNDLMGRGHNVFYSAPPASVAAVIEYLTRGFPRLFRANIGYFLTASLLFFGPLGLTWGAVWIEPELAARIVPNEVLDQYESQYGDRAEGMPESAGKTSEGEVAEEGERVEDDSGEDWKNKSWRETEERFDESRNMMFGLYIYNNVGIAFRCFALGVLLGVGTVYVLLFNGIYIGAVAGYLCGTGHSDRFLSFVVSHGSFELTAIAVAGGAGLMLGNAIIHPGQRSRIEALIDRALEAVQIAGGAAVMLAIAALIEAFWSPPGVPAALKYTVAAGLWVSVFLYLGLAGRDRGTIAARN